MSVGLPSDGSDLGVKVESVSVVLGWESEHD